MNEISVSVFLFISAMCLVFLTGSILLNNKIFAFISSVLSMVGFVTLAQLILNGNVGIFYVSGTDIEFNPVQSVTLHYFYYAIGFVSIFLSLYIFYEIVMEFFANKNKSAFDTEG